MSEQAVAGEERHDGAERQERRERDAHLPCAGAVPREEDDARHERRDHPEHERDRDGPAERRAHQESELHVAHPHAGGAARSRTARLSHGDGHRSAMTYQGAKSEERDRFIRWGREVSSACRHAESAVKTRRVEVRLRKTPMRVIRRNDRSAARRPAKEWLPPALGHRPHGEEEAT